MPKKTVVIDPEGNKIITKTRTTNLMGPKGSSKVIVKYADKESSGRRRDVTTYDPPAISDEALMRKKGGTSPKKYAKGGTSPKKNGIAMMKKGGKSKAFFNPGMSKSKKK